MGRKSWFLRAIVLGLLVEMLLIVGLISSSSQMPTSVSDVPTLASLPTSVADAAMEQPPAPSVEPEVPVSQPVARPGPEAALETEAPPPAAPSQVETDAPPTAVPTLPPFPSPTPLSQAQPLLPPPVEIPQEPLPNQIIITFAPDASQQERDAYVAQLGGEVTQSIDALDTVVVELPADVAAEPLPQSASVAQSEPDYMVTAQIDVPPSDPLYPQQWALPAIGAPDAWLDLPADAPQVTVAVIDSGICADHPDLQGRILPGWDFVEDDADPQDAFGHGCGVAGIIAANVDDGIGMAGVAPNAMVLPLRVLDASGIGAYSDVAAAIVRATDDDAQVINLSLGGAFPSTVLENAISYAIDAGVTVVAAAGNTGSEQVLYPAAYAPVIAVGAVDEQLQPASFSARGDGIDIWAPGQNVLTTQMNGDHTPANGTSFAAPYVAGAAAETALEAILDISSPILKISPTRESIPPTEGAPTPTPTLEMENESSEINVEYGPYVGDPWLRAGIEQTLYVRPETVFPGTVFRIVDERIEQDWAYLSIASLDGPEASEEFVGTGNAGTALLAHRINQNEWDVAIAGTSHFSRLMMLSPERFISTEARNYIDPLIVTQDITASSFGQEFRFPWASGTWEYRGGWHPPEHPIALDIGTHGSDTRFLAAADGWINYFCRGTDTAYVRIVHLDGTTLEYWHLDVSTLDPAIQAGGWVFRGQRLGNGAQGLFNDDCGYSVNQQADSTHIHWVIPHTFTADGWTIVYPDNTWRRGAETRVPGQSLPSSNYPIVPQGQLYTATHFFDQWPYLFQASDSRVRGFSVDGGGRIIFQSDCDAVWVSLSPGNHGIDFWYEDQPIPGTPSIEITPYPVLIPPVCAGEPTDPPVQPTPPPSGSDATPPMASWTFPSDGSTINIGTLTLSADASDDPGGSGVSEVRFSAKWNGVWSSVGADTSAPYSFDWDWCAAGVPDGDIELGLVASDNADNLWIYSNYFPNIHVTKSFDCGQLPTPTPTATGTPPPIPQIEIDALIALYNSTDGPNWTRNDGWLSGASPCTWYGISCQDGHVIAIILVGNQLIGAIPSSLQDLTNLQELSLLSNQLTGAIPHELGRLLSLEQLYLYSNQLSGSIPAELGNLTNLQELSLWGNQLSGTIPPELGNLLNIELLVLSANQLSGDIPIALGNLPALERLYLNSNQLSGSIPAELGNLTNLQELSLWGNQLTGAIPLELGNLLNLQLLGLRANQLSGSIPAELGNLTNLQELSLWGNQLTGAIPLELGNLLNLQILDLTDNQLSGSIPAELGNLTNLKYLSLAVNQLTGTIPHELGNLLGLESLSLGFDQLSGEIPAELGNLTNLQILNLYNNRLSGAIPTELGNLTNLKYLSLAVNQLTGTIPDALGNLVALEQLYLSANQLSGAIPVSLGNLLKLQYLHLGDNQLSGGIPESMGNLLSLEQLYLSANQLSGAIPVSLGNLLNLQFLGLAWNQLGGDIPFNMTNLVNLATMDLSHNMLTASDPAVRAFVDIRDSTWEQTQTIAPENMQVLATTNSNVELVWEPILYTADGGYFEVMFSTHSGGAFDQVGCITPDKTVAGCTAQGLSPNTTYYFAVRTFTPAHDIQQNDLTSGFSPEVSATTLPIANDTTPPTGGIVAPVLGLAFNGTTIDIIADASDDSSGVNRVEFWANYEMGGVTEWRLLGTINAAPYTYTWDWSLLADQPVEFRIDIYDNAGNSTLAAGGTISVYLDRTLPTASFSNPLENAYLNVNSVMLEVAASDTFTGVSGVQFYAGYNDAVGAGLSGQSAPPPAPPAPDAVATAQDVVAQDFWHDLGWDTDGSDGWSLLWDASAVSDQLGIAFYIYACDLANNCQGAGVYNITLDRTPPTSAVDPLPAESAFFIVLFWQGADNVSGIASYDIQASDNGGAWTDVYTGTTSVGGGLALFPGHTFAFRSRARDWAGNVEDWPTQADTSTTIVAPPANDEVSGAIVIENLSFTNSQDVFPATYLYDPFLCPNENAFNIVWYQYTPITAQVVTVDTVGSEFDTVLGIFTDPPGDATRVACDNDSGGNLTSRVAFNAAAGTTYYIAAGKATYPQLTSPAQLVLNVTAEVADTTPPVITLLGANPLSLTVGDTFTEPGYTATDDVDGDITANVVVTGTVDTNTVGSYTLTYNVSDAAGNPATPVTRSVNVIAATASVEVTFTIAGGHATHTLPLEVMLVDPATSAIVLQQSLTSSGDASNGHFSLSGITPGSYSLYIKGSNTLRSMQSVTLTAGSNAVTFTALRSGDANGDNVVSLADFSILALSFNKTEGTPGYDGRADFNGDNVVSLADFSKLALNFNTVGAQLPPP